MGKKLTNTKMIAAKKLFYLLILNLQSSPFSLHLLYVVNQKSVAGVKAEISFRSKFWKLLQHSPFSQKRVFHLTLGLVCSISVFAFSKLSNFKGLGFTNSSKASEMLKSERVFYFFLQADVVVEIYVLFIYSIHIYSGFLYKYKHVHIKWFLVHKYKHM